LHPGGGKSFFACPDDAKAHPALCTMGTTSFQQVVLPEHGADHSLCSKVANGFDLHLHLCSMPAYAYLGGDLYLH